MGKRKKLSIKELKKGLNQGLSLNDILDSEKTQKIRAIDMTSWEEEQMKRVGNDHPTSENVYIEGDPTPKMLIAVQKPVEVGYTPQQLMPIPDTNPKSEIVKEPYRSDEFDNALNQSLQKPSRIEVSDSNAQIYAKPKKRPTSRRRTAEIVEKPKKTRYIWKTALALTTLCVLGWGGASVYYVSSSDAKKYLGPEKLGKFGEAIEYSSGLINKVYNYFNKEPNKK